MRTGRGSTRCNMLAACCNVVMLCCCEGVEGRVEAGQREQRGARLEVHPLPPVARS